MVQAELIPHLRRYSTWILLGLGIVTYGVYYAHYCARQSRIINRALDQDRQIPDGLIKAFLTLSYVSLVLFFGYLVVDDDHPIAFLSNLADKVWMVLLVVWGFYARNRMNQISGASDNDPDWFHGFWTFLFTPLYFNYKVNVLDKLHPAPMQQSGHDDA